MARGSGTRALLVLLLVLVGLAVVVDFGARFVVERTFASRVRAELRLDESPDVSLRGFPFLFSLARREFHEATIEARDIDAGGLRFRAARLELEDVRFSMGGGLIRAERGTGQAEVSEEAISTLLQGSEVPLDVRFRDPRVRVRTTVAAGGTEVGVRADGEMRLEGGESLVFAPESVEADGGVQADPGSLAFRISLPRLLEGLSYESLSVERGVAVLEVSLRHAIIRVR